MKTVWICLLAVLATACGSSSSTTGSGGEGGSGGAGGGMGSNSSWTYMALFDEKSTDGGKSRFHSGEDRVTSIHFSALDKGLVATSAAGQSNQGGLFRANATKITGMAIDKDALDLDSFINIFKTQAGYAATLATAESTVLSNDNGTSFTKVRTNLPYGLSRSVVLHDAPDNKWTWVGASGVIAESATPPSLTAVWSALWAPQGIPPFPNPVPPAPGCQKAPIPPSNPIPEQYVYVSPNRQFVAFTVYVDSADAHQICLSNDFGKTFLAKKLVHDQEHKQPNGANGITFINDTTGFVFAGDFLAAGAAYIQKTTDKGVTWSANTLPAALKAQQIEIRHVFFAPDGVNGFAVGWYYSPFGPLVLVTTDAGNTWSASTTTAALKEQMGKDTFGSKLYTGFAFDKDHLWVGGERGAVYANSKGGQ